MVGTARIVIGALTMTEYMSFYELMQAVKEGDLINVESSSLVKLKFSDGVLRYHGGSKSTYDCPWLFRYKIIKPEPEMITLTRPKVFNMAGSELSHSCSTWAGSSAEWNKSNLGCVSFGEWETITVPKNKEDWIDGDT